MVFCFAKLKAGQNKEKSYWDNGIEKDGVIRPELGFDKKDIDSWVGQRWTSIGDRAICQFIRRGLGKGMENVVLVNVCERLREINYRYSAILHILDKYNTNVYFEFMNIKSPCVWCHANLALTNPKFRNIMCAQPRGFFDVEASPMMITFHPACSAM